MIKLTRENTQNAIAKAKELRPKVVYIRDRVFEVKSANNGNSYTVRFEVKNGEKFGSCECKAGQNGKYACYHLVAAAQVNIIRQSVKRQTA